MKRSLLTGDGKDLPSSRSFNILKKLIALLFLAHQSCPTAAPRASRQKQILTAIAFSEASRYATKKGGAENHTDPDLPAMRRVIFSKTGYFPSNFFISRPMARPTFM